MSRLRVLRQRTGGSALVLAGAVLVVLAGLALVTARRPHPDWFTGVDPASLLAGLLAALGAAALTVVPAVLRAFDGPELGAVQLPGWAPARRRLPDGVVAAAPGVLAAVVAALLVAGPAWVALVLVVLGSVLAVACLAGAARRPRDRSERRLALHRALGDYAPQVAVYTARENGAGYQLAPWLPELDAMGLRYVVVVRHADAAAAAQPLTDAPVVCCPRSADLDAVLAPSLRVACYVNGVAQNVNFVGYRQLRHVYLGHGDSDKELSVHPAQAMFDEIFVAGPAAVERYAQAGVPLPADKFVEVGRPQLAGVGRAAGPISASDPPRVLVAPTWGGYNAASRLGTVAGLPALVAALLDRGAVVQLRPHPLSREVAAEAAVLTEVDRQLVEDRNRTGRAHLTSRESATVALVQAFDGCDALVTDVGSVLVDFFATGKPYAVTLPDGVSVQDAHARFPSVRAAYLITRTDLADPLTQLLDTDPGAAARDVVARHYLGGRPGDAEPFRSALTATLTAARHTAPR